jgi:hypothetical protein
MSIDYTCDCCGKQSNKHTEVVSCEIKLPPLGCVPIKQYCIGCWAHIENEIRGLSERRSKDRRQQDEQMRGIIKKASDSATK